MKKLNETMNPNDFENQLRRQQFRSVPADWRNDLLAAATRSSIPIEKRTNKRTGGFLERMLWPCPQAWAGLAAIWLVILAINFSDDDKTQVIAQKEPPPSPEVFLAVKAERRLLAQLVEPTEQPLAERPKPFIPRPRSEIEKFITIV
jgi:hypothetical protein